MNSQDWITLSEAYAFLGNSLLLSMNQTADLGADPAFWEAFPDFGSAKVRAAADGCAAWARRAGDGGKEAAVQEAAVEHTRLFAGPPRPAAAPWETFYRGDGEVNVGFGQATAEMRALLREAGLEVSGPSNQYADHMGIELLLLSELCRRAAQAKGEEDAVELGARIAAFMADHPLGWADKLLEAAEVAAPQGYIAGLVGLEQALLSWHASQLAE